MINKIDINQIEFSNHTVDPCGRIFYWEGRLFRGIYNESVGLVKEMFDSGMIDELVRKKLIPATTITEYSIDGFGMVIEHKKISRISYPHEWSFSMLKDAMLTILKVNMLSVKYGFQTKDGHVYNIVFDKCLPLFVDIGSFIKTDYSYWHCYHSFMRCFDILKKWSTGNFYYASRLISDDYPARYYSINKKISIQNIYNIYLRFFSKNKIVNGLVLQVSRIFSRIFPLNKCLFTINNINILYKKVSKIKYKSGISRWSGYHDALYKKNDLISTARFDEIAKITLGLGDIKSATDLASNQGVFSRILIRKTSVEEIICMDNDEIAIECLYQKIKNQESENNIIIPVLQNMLWPSAVSYLIPHPSSRFKSDAVYALAITHHLVLSQNFPLSKVLEEIAMYSKKYVFIEFMPLGLYNGKSPVRVPSWYTADWFRNEFVKTFDIIKEKKLEENRIIFVGKIKQ